MTANRSGAFRAKRLSREPGCNPDAPVAHRGLRGDLLRAEEQANGYGKPSEPPQIQHRPAR
ncbi:MAG: hypothetical protein NUW01_07855 [Gemmatimonadaceae bacterium]|nr:hypothetical protein [Gemmatimonadaceae bacterium]